jgi:hypothetical protein
MRAGPQPPSVELLWRLAVIPAVLLSVTVLGSLAILLGAVSVSDDRLSALWVLLASLIATLGAFLGALIAATTQQRTATMEDQGRQRGLLHG